MTTELIVKLKDPDPGGEFRIDLNPHTFELTVSVVNPSRGEYDNDDLEALTLEIRNIISGHPGATFQRSFPRYVQALRVRGTSWDWQLELYFRLRLPAGTDSETIAEDLKRLSVVVHRVSPAWPIQPASSPQGYIEPGEDGGMDIELAWDPVIEGGRGENVQVCVIEHTFWTDHPFLDGPPAGQLENTDHQIAFIPGTAGGPSSGHSTMTLGVLVAQPEGLVEGALQPGPVKGIVHRLEKCWVSSLSVAGSVTQAFDRARFAVDAALGPEERILQEGDVILIPYSTTPDENKNTMPVEANEDVRVCLRTAITEDKLVVVEAAGNGNAGGQDLDPLPEIISVEGDEHSKAIVVGAGRSPCSLFPLTPMNSSNYGARVDCQAWGECYQTTRFPPSPYSVATLYTTEFGLTSGASTIIAGIAAILQSVHKAAFGGNPIQPKLLRDALKNPLLGQEPDPPPGTIGPLPDLRKLLDHFQLLPDTFIRRTSWAPDTMAPLFGPPTYKSPDIIPLKQRPDDPTGYLGGIHWDSDDKAETLRRGDVGWVFLRLENRGPFPDDTTVSLYWTKWGHESSPSDWEKIRDVSVHLEEAGSGMERVVKGVLWDQVPNVKSLSLIAVVESKYYQRPGFSGGPVQEADLGFLGARDKVAFRTVRTKRKLWGCLFFWMEWFQ